MHSCPLNSLLLVLKLLHKHATRSYPATVKSGPYWVCFMFHVSCSYTVTCYVPQTTFLNYSDDARFDILLTFTLHCTMQHAVPDVLKDNRLHCQTQAVMTLKMKAAQPFKMSINSQQQQSTTSQQMRTFRRCQFTNCSFTHLPLNPS